MIGADASSQETFPNAPRRRVHCQAEGAAPEPRGKSRPVDVRLPTAPVLGAGEQRPHLAEQRQPLVVAEVGEPAHRRVVRHQRVRGRASEDSGAASPGAARTSDSRQRPIVRRVPGTSSEVERVVAHLARFRPRPIRSSLRSCGRRLPRPSRNGSTSGRARRADAGRERSRRPRARPRTSGRPAAAKTASTEASASGIS